VTPKWVGFGAKLGDVFIELKKSQDAIKILETFKGKKYENREINIVCVPVESYVGYYLNLLQTEF